MNKPYVIFKREGSGPRGGRILLGYEVVEVRTNISLRRFPSISRARALRDQLNKAA